MVTDMSFRATVIALKVVLLATGLLAILAFAYMERSQSMGPRIASDFLVSQGLQVQ